MELYLRPEVVSATSSGEWVDLVTMPASDVRVGNAYAFVLTGIVGSWTTGLLRSEIVEVTLRAGSSVYQSQHRLDLQTTRFQRSTGRYGCPFTIIVVVPSAANSSYSLSLRADARPAIECLVDAPTMQAWDLTQIGAGNYQSTFNATPTTLSHTTPTLLAQLPQLSPGRKWLVWYAAEIEQKAWAANASDIAGAGGIWLARNVNPGLKAKVRRRYFNGSGPESSHIGIGPRASSQARLTRDYVRIRLGDFYVSEDPGGETPVLYGQHMFGTSNMTPDIVRRVDMFAVDLTKAGVYAESDRRQLSTIITPGKLDDLLGYRDEPRTRAIGLPVTKAMYDASLVSVRIFSDGRGLPRKYGFAADVAYQQDGGGIVNPIGWAPTRVIDTNAMHVVLEDIAECLPIHRMHRGSHDVGTTCHRLYGRIVERSGDNVALWAQHSDFEVLHFMPVDGYTEPAPIYETAGPEVAVRIRKESPLDLTSLPPLPVGVSASMRAEDPRPTVTQRSEQGYALHRSRFVTVSEIWDFEYRGVTKAKRLEVEAFLSALPKVSNGTFRATPMRDELAFVLDVSNGHSVEREAGLYTIRFSAAELRFL
ncbi:MAG: hypothetical protein KDC95_09775 [Planctomycetes bacterium]|nr:hypothetical protein [Planctomycetota bacterium]